MQAYERFIRFAAVHTTSDENSDTVPTSFRQLDLAGMLVSEMWDIGLKKVRISQKGYVYGEIPATPGCENAPAIGFIAHMDTSPDACGESVKPQIIKDYDGRDVVLRGNGQVLSTAMFPHLTELKGRTLITSDGTTLLGADDKAGIAEILTACEKVIAGKMPHGRICIGFTPDEEVGKGADHFDVAEFGADFAYTVDGGPEGELEYENFNAARAVLTIHGVSVHPGSAKNIMVNALAVACELNGMLPPAETPDHTEGYQGFYFLHRFEGSTEKAVIEYSLRDHNMNLLNARSKTLEQAVRIVNEKHGAGTVTITITEQYKNMAEVINQNFHLIENARLAIKKQGLAPIENPLRGGTDGARLSYMGLPCPNLGTGGYAYHGCFEHITAEGMNISTNIIMELISIYSQKTK